MSIPPFTLEPGERILWVRRAPADMPSALEVRVVTADGAESVHDIYPGQDPGPDVAAVWRIQQILDEYGTNLSDLAAFIAARL